MISFAMRLLSPPFWDQIYHESLQKLWLMQAVRDRSCMRLTVASGLPVLMRGLRRQSDRFNHHDMWCSTLLRA